MATLNPEIAGEVRDTESTSFEPVPAGAYHLRLTDVDAEREGQKGPYWRWEFTGVEGAATNRKFWVNTSLSKAAFFKLKETFAAFGHDDPTGVDTDDLLGQVVKGHVVIRTIQGGDRKGEPTNEVSKLVKADDSFEAPDAPAKEESIF